MVHKLKMTIHAVVEEFRSKANGQVVLVLQGGGALGAFLLEPLDYLGMYVIHDALMARRDRAFHHVGAHSPETDHS